MDPAGRRTPAGTIVMIDGVGGPVMIGTVTDKGSSFGRIHFSPRGGDSGAVVFKPQPDGTATIYGIITHRAGSTGIY